jgi:hypothetical protein
VHQEKASIRPVAVHQSHSEHTKGQSGINEGVVQREPRRLGKKSCVSAGYEVEDKRSMSSGGRQRYKEKA